MSKVRICQGGLRSRLRSLVADQRGAAAFEMLIIYLFLMFSLLLPLADMAIAGFRLISAYQALRDMGQRTQYSPPADVTNSSSITSWANSLPATISGYPITPNVYCGSPGVLAPCASSTTLPKYYTFTTTVTLTPMVLGSVLCSTCTISYSQRFQ
jgi:hypothetical protein